MSKPEELKSKNFEESDVSSSSKSHHIHDNQKIEELNNKLGSYINLVNYLKAYFNFSKTILSNFIPK